MSEMTPEQLWQLLFIEIVKQAQIPESVWQETTTSCRVSEDINLERFRIAFPYA